MKKVVSALLVVFVGCASVQKKTAETSKDYTISPERWVEMYGLPDEPVVTSERGSFAISEGDVSPSDGICLSEQLAVEYRNFRNSYENIRSLYESDQTVWQAHREVYETKIQGAEAVIQDLEKPETWWNKHDSQVLGFSGFFLGVLTTIAVTFAVDGAQK